MTSESVITVIFLLKIGKNRREKYDIIYLRKAKGTPQSAKRMKEGIKNKKEKSKDHGREDNSGACQDCF